MRQSRRFSPRPLPHARPWQHPDVAEEYAALKKNLAERHSDDWLGYTDAKSKFVAAVLRAARS